MTQKIDKIYVISLYFATLQNFLTQYLYQCKIVIDNLAKKERSSSCNSDEQVALELYQRERNLYGLFYVNEQKNDLNTVLIAFYHSKLYKTINNTIGRISPLGDMVGVTLFTL